MTLPLFSDHPAHIRWLADVARQAADPLRLTWRALRVAEGRLITPAGVFELARRRLFLVSVGKAAPAMAQAAALSLGPALTAGLVISKATRPPTLPPRLTYYAAGHPLPTAASLTAARAVARLLQSTTAQDMVLCLISGGTSALLSQPRLPLPAWQALNRALLAAGCPIQTINQVRQALDEVKGGGLAAWAAPATCLSLIISDVIGNDLAVVGSGPTVPWPRHPAAVWAALEAYQVWERLPAVVAAQVRQALPELPSAAPVSAGPIHNHIIGDVGVAAQAVTRAAQQLGFDARLVSVQLTGEARQVGADLALRAQHEPPNSCLVYGGETTVTLNNQGEGYGGRNQELALAAAVALAGRPAGVVASFATDGDDGLPPPGAPAVAGAWAAGTTVAQGAALGLSATRFLARQDSYTYFAALGRGHLWLPAGTNVNDITLALRYAAPPDA